MLRELTHRISALLLLPVALFLIGTACGSNPSGPDDGGIPTQPDRDDDGIPDDDDDDDDGDGIGDDDDDDINEEG